MGFVAYSIKEPSMWLAVVGWTNGRIIPIGRKYRAGFKDRYFTYKENENEYSRYNR